MQNHQKKTIGILALLLVLNIATQAQIPGYQGLRFIAKYNCGINHPGLFGRPGRLPAVFHIASLEYTVSRQWAIGINYGFMFYNDAPAPKTLFASNESYNKINRSDFKGKYLQHTTSIYGKYYIKRRGFIAPVGPYVIAGLYYQYSRNIFYSPPETQYTPGTRPIQQNNIIAHHMGIHFGMGRNFVVLNRMVIDLGFTLNLTAPNPAIVAESGFGGSQRVAYNDLILRNLFQLHLGLGVLAF